LVVSPTELQLSEKPSPVYQSPEVCVVQAMQIFLKKVLQDMNDDLLYNMSNEGHGVLREMKD